MNRDSVNSSALKSVGYDEENQILEVEILQTGEVYQYKNVPIEEYFLFLEQPSLGTYYNKEFKKKLPDYIKVSQLSREPSKLPLPLSASSGKP